MRGRSLLSILPEIGVKTEFVIDSNSANWGTKVEDIPIVSPDKLCSYKSTPICIAIGNVQEKLKIRKDIREKYIYSSIEYDFFDLVYEAYSKIFKRLHFVDRKSQNEIKILFDCHNGLVIGGIELWTEELCLELLGRGWNQLRIICNTQEYDKPKEIVKLVDHVDIDNKRKFGKDTFINIVQYLYTQMPFVVITSFPDVILMAACLLKKAYPGQVRIISVVHHGETEHYDVNIKFKNEVDSYIGVSEDIKQELLNRGAYVHQAFSMTCPVQCEEILDRTYSVSCETPIRIGYAGRLIVYKKRVDLLLEMINALEKIGVNYKFEIAGEGPDSERMAQFINQHNLTHKITLNGVIARSQILDFWKRQDICVNIADCEGRCISKMEAMAGGAVPVITDVAGTREDITDGENGYIVPVGGYETMAERIHYLSVHRDLLPQMGKKAHDSIFLKSQMSEHVVFWEKQLKGLIEEIRDGNNTN